MKLRTLLPSIIFLMGALSARAQITQVYYQGFETGDNVTYRADQPSCINYSSTIFMGGARALKLDQSASGDVTFSDGKTGKWYLDQMGRLGLGGDLPQGYRPSPTDAALFQQQLMQLLQSKGLC